MRLPSFFLPTAFAACLLLAGCAQHYTRTGATPDMVASDMEQCHTIARKAVSSDANSALIGEEERKCMRLKGYGMAYGK